MSIIRSVNTMFFCGIFVILSVICFSSCSQLLFTAYSTPEKAIESSYDDIIQDAEIYLIEEKIDLIEQDDIAIYIYRAANETLQIAYLEIRNDGYVKHEIKSYYEKNDVNSNLEVSDNLSPNNRIYCKLSLNDDERLDDYTKKTYKLNIFGETNNYYFYYKIVNK